MACPESASPAVRSISRGAACPGAWRQLTRRPRQRQGAAVEQQLPLTRCSCARAGARQLPGRWRGVSGVDVDLLIAPLPAGVRVTAGLGGVTWRSRRLAVLTAGCSALLLATSHAGQPHPAGASERHPPALLLSSGVFLARRRPTSARRRCLSGLNVRCLLFSVSLLVVFRARGSIFLVHFKTALK